MGAESESQRLVAGSGPQPLRPPGPALRRPDGGVQLGLAPGHGAVLDGLSDDHARSLTALDGTLDLGQMVGRDDSPDLLAALEATGALARVDQRRRSAAYVVVDGAGPLPSAITDHLRVAGVARVEGGGYAVDALLGAAAGPVPAVVVLVGSGPVAAHRATTLRTRHLTHLPVWVHGGFAVVGPLVRPGVSACLQCLDHAQADRDPARPVLGPRADGGVLGSPRRVAGDPSLVSLVAATASMVALAEVDGQCPGGVSLELSLPWPRVVQRRWEPHPLCPCGAAFRAPSRLGAQWSA